MMAKGWIPSTPRETQMEMSLEFGLAYLSCERLESEPADERTLSLSLSFLSPSLFLYLFITVAIK